MTKNEVSDRNSTIHNVRLESHFTIISNATAEDPNLSWNAKGLLLYILTRPQDWVIYTWQLAAIYNGDKKGNGIKAVWSILRELRDAGYVNYIKNKNEKGQWVHRYDVYPMAIEKFKKKAQQEKQTKQPKKPKKTPEKQPKKPPENDIENIRNEEIPETFQKIIPHTSEPRVGKGCILTSTELPNTDINIIAKPEPPSEKRKNTPAGGNNKLYSCLENMCTDLSDRQKRMLMKYSEAQVKQAVRYAYHPTTTIEGGPIGRLKLMQYFLKNPESFKDKMETLDKPPEKRSKKELLLGRFKIGETYNGYEFLQDEIGVGFIKSGMPQPYSVYWKSPNFAHDFLKLLEKLKIEP